MDNIIWRSAQYYCITVGYGKDCRVRGQLIRNRRVITIQVDWLS